MVRLAFSPVVTRYIGVNLEICFRATSELPSACVAVFIMRVQWNLCIKAMDHLELKFWPSYGEVASSLKGGFVLK